MGPCVACAGGAGDNLGKMKTRSFTNVADPAWRIPCLFVLAAIFAWGCSSGDVETDGGADGAGPPDDGANLTDWGADGGDSTPGDDAGGGADLLAGDDGGPGDAADSGDPGVSDPCPDLPVPTSCFNRSVVYRVWGPDAKGDGTFFSDQAPYRLGFNRIENLVWIVKFRTDPNTYRARLSAYGDSSAGIAWIGESPCDPGFAITQRAYEYGIHGGGDISFLVIRDAADAERVRTESPYREDYASWPKLWGGHCYYLGFENTGYEVPQPMTADFFSSTPDTCGHTLPDGSYDPSCYYLAMDFFHYLMDPITGDIMRGSVIDGLTHLP